MGENYPTQLQLSVKLTVNSLAERELISLKTLIAILTILSNVLPASFSLAEPNQNARETTDGIYKGKLPRTQSRAKVGDWI